MLDLAFGLTQTSRLGCQVVAEKELDGLVVRLPSVRCDRLRAWAQRSSRACSRASAGLLPSCLPRHSRSDAHAPAAPPRIATQATRNFAVDGHVPKPH